MSDRLLVEVGRLKSLESLTMPSGGNVTDAGLASLRPLRRLKQLHLGDSSVMGPGLKQLEELRHLENLVLSEILVADDDLAFLSRMGSLECLQITGGRLTDRGLMHLAGLERLRWLALSAPGMTSNGLGSLEHLPRLKSLLLFDTKVDRLEPLGRFQALERLTLGRSRVSESEIVEFRKNRPSVVVTR